MIVPIIIKATYDIIAAIKINNENKAKTNISIIKL